MHLEKELVRSSAVLSTTIPEWREPRVHATAKAHFCLRSCVKLPGAIDASSLLVGDVWHQPRNRLIRRHQSRLTSLSRQNHPMRPALRHLSHHTSPNQNPLMHPDRKLLVRIDHLLHRGSHQSSSTVRPRSRTPFMYQHQSRTTNPLSSSTRE